MNNEKVYLTFPTNPQISFILKKIAHEAGKTQPELINEICENYVKEYLLSIIDQELDIIPAPGPAGAGEPEAEK